MIELIELNTHSTKRKAIEYKNDNDVTKIIEEETSVNRLPKAYNPHKRITLMKQKMDKTKRFEDYSLDEIIENIYLSPVIPLRKNIEFIFIDETIQIGLLCKLYKWAVPLHYENEKDKTSLYYKPIHISIYGLENLLKYIPTTFEEFEKIEYINHLVTIKVLNTNERKTYADEIIDLITNYLISRNRLHQEISIVRLYRPLISDNLTIDDLKLYNLTLPLNYNIFQCIVTLAYGQLGGRYAIEERKGVKGLLLTNSNNTVNGTISSNTSNGNAMYGGVRELFVEKQIVQRMSLGLQHKFLDIGSGIGQVSSF